MAGLNFWPPPIDCMIYTADRRSLTIPYMMPVSMAIMRMSDRAMSILGSAGSNLYLGCVFSPLITLLLYPYRKR